MDNTNPSREEIRQLVLQVRKQGTTPVKGSDMRAEADAFKKEDLQNIIAELPDDYDSAYVGFYEEDDRRVMSIMAKAGASNGLADIMVMPGNEGMKAQSGGSNSAVTLLDPGKILTFQTIALTNYGPGSSFWTEEKKKDKKNTAYKQILARIQLGTILISRSLLLGDETALMGNIWHECGHKLLNQPKEAGQVFAFELRQVRENLGIQAARKWIMGGPPGRTPGYFRDYGLKIDPGKTELLLELKQILLDEDFSREFGEQYAAIMGVAPKEKEVEKETASGSVSVGSTVKGKIAALRKMMPEADIKKTRGDILPGGAGIGATVKFAGKQWKVLGKTTDFPIVWELECTSLTEFSEPVKAGEVFAFGTDHGTRYGLTVNGPWIYADLSSAQKDHNVLYVVKQKIMAEFKNADEALVERLVLEYIGETAEKQL